MKIWMVFSVFLMLLCGFSPVPNREKDTARAFETIMVKRQSFSKTNSSEAFKLEINYPLVELSGSNEEGKVYQVNYALQAIMVKSLEDFSEGMKQNQNKFGQSGLNYLTLDFQVYNENNGVVSLKFLRHISYNGIVTTERMALGFNYDFTSSKDVQLADLFVSNDYEKRIKSFADRQNVKIRSFQNFCLSANGIVMTLDPSTSSLKETQDLLIPWQEVADILAKNNLVKAFYHN